MGDLRAPLNPSPAVRATAFREDCWSEEATATLIDAWGSRYLMLNRGNLRQKDWQDVADAVNSRHGHTKKLIRSDIQCKNRIDTIKKRYKAEKVKVSESGGALVSPWRFLEQLDVLIGPKKGDAFTRRTTPPGGSGFNAFRRGEASRTGMGTPPMAIVLHREANHLPEAVAVTPLKRTSALVDDSYFRQNYSAMAAAAAKDEADYEEEYSEEEEMEVSGEERGGKQVLMDVEDRRGKQVLMDVEERRGKQVEMDAEERGGKQVEMDSTKMLAMAIDRFGEMYERVEMKKLGQFMEIEHRRIDVGRDVELQRTQLLMDTKIQIAKLKRQKAKNKSSGLDDICSS